MVQIVRVNIVLIISLFLASIFTCASAQPPILPTALPSQNQTDVSPQAQETIEPTLHNSPELRQKQIPVSATPAIRLTVAGAKHVSSKTIYMNRSSLLELSAEGTGSSLYAIEYHFDASPDWRQYNEPISLQNRTEGSHTLFFRFKDRVEKTEEHTAHLYIDDAPPSSTLTIGNPQSRSKEGRLFISGSTQFTIASADAGSGVAQIEYRLDKNDWSIYREPFRISDEGEHRLEYRGVDELNNIETVKSVRITVDNTPPITTLSVNGQAPDSNDSLVINRPVTVTLEGYDLLSGVRSTEYRIDQGKWTHYSPFRVKGNASHQISFRSMDNEGNLEQVKTVTIKIDRTPPVSSIIIGEPHITTPDGSYVASEITFFTISARDTLSSVTKTEYRLDNGEWIEYQPFNIQKTGRHRIEFRSMDRAGNIEQPRQIYVSIMTTPPITRISVNNKAQDSGSTVSSALPLTVTVNTKDSGAGIKSVEYRLNGSTWLPYKPFTISNEGEHIVEVRSTDKLGNTETTRFVKLLIDRSPPQTELVIGGPNRIDKGTVYITDKTVLALSAKDPLSGVSKSEYLIEGTRELSGSEPFSILTSGNYKIRYWSIDRLGNRENERQTSIVVEAVKPSPQDALAKVIKPVDMSAKENNKLSQSDSDIPESIRLAPKPVEAIEKKESAQEQPLPSELLVDTFFNKAPGVESGVSIDPDRNNKLFTSGGINAAIIAIIMLIL